MSVDGLNYCLKALIDKVYLYHLMPRGIAEKVALTSWFLKRQMEEYDALKLEIEALKAEVGEDRLSTAEAPV